MKNLLRGGDNSQNIPGFSFRPSMAFTLRARRVQIGFPADLSLYSHGYAPLIRKHFASFPHLLASILLSPAGS
jgi:hypothetical protein